MQRELLLLREMRDAAVAIRDLVGDRTAEQVGAETLRRSALLWHFTVLGEAGSQPMRSAAPPGAPAQIAESAGPAPPTLPVPRR